MKKSSRKRIYVTMAASIASAVFSANANAQMPGHQFSPWNQIGRAWGIGIGDGYHECADCPRGFSKGYGINAFTTSGERSGRSPEFNEKSSWISKMNPFAGGNDTGMCGVPGCTVCGQSNQNSYTVLPPSSGSYQQFATPAETPLPWTSAPQTQYPSTTIPYGQGSVNHSPSQQQPYSVPQPQPVPDPRADWMPNSDPIGPAPRNPEYQTPAPRYSEPTPAVRPEAQLQYEDNRETVEPKRMPDGASVGPQGDSMERSRQPLPLPSPNDDLPGNDYLLDSQDVPPPPALRRPSPSDRPLGQDQGDEPLQKSFENQKSPRVDDSDSLLPMDDESFELVPGRDLPPVTRYRMRPYPQQPSGNIQASSVTFSRNAPMQQPIRNTNPPVYRHDPNYSQPQSNRYENPYTYKLR